MTLYGLVTCFHFDVFSVAALKVHCSAECKAILDKLGGYSTQERGYVTMKVYVDLLTHFHIPNVFTSEVHIKTKIIIINSAYIHALPWIVTMYTLFL